MALRKIRVSCFALCALLAAGMQGCKKHQSAPPGLTYTKNIAGQYNWAGTAHDVFTNDKIVVRDTTCNAADTFGITVVNDQKITESFTNATLQYLSSNDSQIVYRTTSNWIGFISPSYTDTVMITYNYLSKSIAYKWIRITDDSRTTTIDLRSL